MNDTQIPTNTQSSMPRLGASFIIFLGLLTAMGPLLMDLYLPALPMLPGEFHVGPSIIQLTLTTTMVGLALGQIVIGPISDAFGRKRPLVIGLFLGGVASLWCGQATTIDSLLWGRFWQGFFGAAGLVIARAIARDLASGQELTKLMATLMMVNGFAPVIAPLIGGQVLALWDWHMVFYVLTGISLVLTLWALVYGETLAPDQRLTGGFRSTVDAFHTLRKDRQFMAVCMIQWFAFGAFFCYIAGSSFIFQNIYHLSTQEYSYLFGAMSLGIMGASALARRASNVYEPRQLLHQSLWVSLIGSLCYILAMYCEAPLWLIIVILLPTISTVSVMGSSSFSIAMENYGYIAGSASALLGFFALASAGLMAPLVGIAGESNGLPMGYIMLLGNAIALFFFHRYLPR